MKRKCKNGSLLMVLFFAVALTGQVGAVARTWDHGAGDNDWFTAANWDPNGNPDYSDSLTVNSGSPSTSGLLYICDGGSVTFNNSGTTGSFHGMLSAGHTGIGTLDIKNGAAVTSAAGYIGYTVGSTGTATVDGSGSTWDTGSYSLNVTYKGTGTLNIKNGADVTCGSGRVGYESGSVGTVLVDGSGSTWSTNGVITVGDFGTGTLDIKNGAQVTSSAAGYIGFQKGSTGTVTVDGSGSTWNVGIYSLRVGYYGTATLNVRNDAQVTTGTVFTAAYGTVDLSDGKISANVSNEGTFRGEGDVTGSMSNAGILSPGNSPGYLSIGGNYTQGSSGILLIEMRESGCGVLDITGTASLAGTLSVSFFDEYVPDVGDFFDVLWADTISGEFDYLDLSSLPPGSNFHISYNLNETGEDFVRLTCVPEPATIYLLGLGVLVLTRKRNKQQRDTKQFRGWKVFRQS